MAWMTLGFALALMAEPAPALATSVTVPAAIASARPTPSPTATLPGHERARYDVAFGVLGTIGTAEIEFTPPTTGAGASAWRAHGHARGSLFGFAENDRTLDAEIDGRTGQPTRWTLVRKGEAAFVDDTAQTEPGHVAMVRRRAGRSDEPRGFAVAQPVLEPLSFLWALRTATAGGRPFDDALILDGRQLWRVATHATATNEVWPTPLGPRTGTRFDGRAVPVLPDGRVDGTRDEQAFSIWTLNDPYHTPLRVELPYGPGEITVALVGLERDAAGLAALRSDHWTHVVRAIRDALLKKQAANVPAEKPTL